MTEENNNKSADELLKEAQKMLDDAQHATGNSAGPGKSVGDKVQKIGDETAYQAKTVYKNVRNPVVKIGHVVKLCAHGARRVGHAYKRSVSWMWNLTDTRRRKNKFTKTLAHIGRPFAAVLIFLETFYLAFSALFIPMQFIPGQLGQALRYPTTDVVHDTVLMALPFSYHKGEQTYLNQVEKINTDTSKLDHNMYEVQGSDVIVNADTNNATIYQVRPSLVNSAWNMLHKGNPFYTPDLVVAGIAPGQNECNVTYYGYRFRIFQGMQDYPTLLEAKCTSLSVNYNDASAATKAQKPAVTAAGKTAPQQSAAQAPAAQAS